MLLRNQSKLPRQWSATDHGVLLGETGQSRLGLCHVDHFLPCIAHYRLLVVESQTGAAQWQFADAYTLLLSTVEEWGHSRRLWLWDDTPLWFWVWLLLLIFITLLPLLCLSWPEWHTHLFFPIYYYIAFSLVDTVFVIARTIYNKQLYIFVYSVSSSK